MRINRLDSEKTHVCRQKHSGLVEFILVTYRADARRLKTHQQGHVVRVLSICFGELAPCLNICCPSFVFASGLGIKERALDESRMAQQEHHGN